MPSVKSVLAGAVALLFVASLTLSWATRGVMKDLASAHVRGAQGNLEVRSLVDTRCWQIAEAVSEQAVTAEEAEYAREAERLASHDVDRAFAGALREAALRSRPTGAEATALSSRIEQLQEVLREDQARIDVLSRPANAVPSASSVAAQQPGTSDLDLAKAQQQLDSDELQDAQGDFARLSGDQRPEIGQEFATFQATLHKRETDLHNTAPAASTSAQRYGTLAGRIRAWLSQNNRYNLLQSALAQTRTSSAELAKIHDRLRAQSNQAMGASDTETRRAQLARLQARSTQRQLLAIYDDRIETEGELAAVYDKWAKQVQLQHRIVTHLLLSSCATIAFVLLCVLILDGLVIRLVNRSNLDRRQRQTLRTILKLVVEISGAIVLLFIVFGAPNQTPTILGLTTAGLTLVLQDFILAFFGWFILMGKNGLRVGDWVEINSVGGEVVEVGLFRTALLETGNWTDKGHPTGRRVTFINSFAIKGQYFNFSTAGQWMWDEITISIPIESDTYAVVEQIRRLVQVETEIDTREAEGEWRRVTRQSSHPLAEFRVEPAVDMRPTVTGIDVIVRYVTSASSRLKIKNRLYGQIIGLLRHAPAPPSS